MLHPYNLSIISCVSNNIAIASTDMVLSSMGGGRETGSTSVFTAATANMATMSTTEQQQECYDDHRHSCDDCDRDQNESYVSDPSPLHVKKKKPPSESELMIRLIAKAMATSLVREYASSTSNNRSSSMSKSEAPQSPPLDAGSASTVECRNDSACNSSSNSNRTASYAHKLVANGSIEDVTKLVISKMGNRPSFCFRHLDNPDRALHEMLRQGLQERRKEEDHERVEELEDFDNGSDYEDCDDFCRSNDAETVPTKSTFKSGHSQSSDIMSGLSIVTGGTQHDHDGDDIKAATMDIWHPNFWITADA